jgi:protein TonB
MGAAMNAQFRLDPSAELYSWPPLAPVQPHYRCVARAVVPRQVNVGAAVASLAIVAGAFASLLYVSDEPEPAPPVVRPMMIIEMRDLQPPPRQPEPKAVKATRTKKPLSAPPSPPMVLQPSLSAIDAPAMPAIAAVSVPQAGPPGPAPAAPVVGPPAGEAAGLSDLSARMISAEPPRYPVQSRRLLEQGTVVLAVLLATNGSVMEIQVARSSGFDRLDEAALRAVRRWRWMPAFHDGNPVLVRGVVTIPFVLKT